MRIPVLHFTAALLIWMAIAADADEFIIPRLKVEGNIEPQAPNAFMEPIPGDAGLMPETNPAPDPRGILLRKRFWNGKGFDYILFRGKVRNPACYRGLNVFRPEGLDRGMMLQRKFLASPRADFYGDLEEVYFQDTLVFAPAVALYYVDKGKPVAARKLDPFLGCLDIRAVPPEAKIHIDGKFAGLAPLYLSRISRRLVNVRISAPGYLPVSHDLAVVPESTTAFAASLIPLPVPTGPGPNLAFLLAPNATNPSDYESREAAVQAYTDSLRRVRDSVATWFDARYPAFSRTDGETGIEEAARRRRYAASKDKQRKLTTAPFDSSLHRYDQGADSLRRLRERMECEPQSLELTGDALQLLEYDANLRSLPFQIDLHTQNLWFTYIGSLELSPKENDRLRARKKDVRMKMIYRRIPLADGQGQRYYFTLDRFRLRLDTLMHLDTVGTGFRYARNLWKTPDSLRVEERIRRCAEGGMAAATRLSVGTQAALGSDRRKAKGGSFWTVAVLGSSLTGVFAILSGTTYSASRDEYARYLRARSEQEAATRQNATEAKKKQAWIYGGLSALSLVGAGTTLMWAF